MALITKYITWTPKYVRKNEYEHPDKAVHSLWNNVLTYAETSYSGGTNDLRHVALVEYDEAKLSNTAFQRFLFNFSEYAFYVETPNRIIELLTEWYGDYFELDTDGITIIDNRPKEEEMI
jgi:hypothetical protein